MFHGAIPGVETQRWHHGNTHIEVVSYNFLPNILMSLSFLSAQAPLDAFPVSSPLLPRNHLLFYTPLPLRLSKQKLIHNKHVDSLASGIKGCFTGLSTSSCEKSVMIWSSHALRLFAAGSSVVSKWVHKLFRANPSKTEMIREGQAGGMPNP